MKEPLHILILAAGKGKRMQSQLPKVLHPVLFKPMLHYVIDLAKSLDHRSISIVVGHKEGQVKEACQQYPEVNFFTQKEQLGTAHAVRAAEDFLSQQTGRILILSGDVISLTKASVLQLLAKQEKTGSCGVILTSVLEQPTGYGRVVRNETGGVSEIREEADCNGELRSIREVNTGIYLFQLQECLTALAKIQNQNRQKEYYLPDIVKVLAERKQYIDAHPLADPTEALGINDRKALWEVEGEMQRRINEEWMLKGVTLRDPKTTWIDEKTRIGQDVTIEPGCQLLNSKVASGVVIEAQCQITDCQISENSKIKRGSYLESSEIGESCSVGPYAHLRPGSKLGKEVKIGNFVELKNSTLGEGTKAAHLSYLGDAKVGKHVNVGCGFITCNYDGVHKRETLIEDEVFIGSDSQTVAPVTLGRGSYVASGTTVTHDVPPDALVFSRVRQTVKAEYAKRYHRKKDEGKK